MLTGQVPYRGSDTTSTIIKHMTDPVPRLPDNPLEAPGVGYRGRSIYTTFGLEGVNNLPDYTSRAELLQHFFAWGWDEPEVIIIDNTPVNGSHLTTFTVEVTSSVVSTTGIPIEGISYRWDFGDGTIVGPFNTSDASHQYALCGHYTVTVEATDSFGNKTIGTLDVNVNENCDAHVNYLPLISKP
jgi:hypothetical protein